jgi:site-specific DNA-methyltransferase (adenine-specific)
MAEQKIIQGDCIETMSKMDAESVHAIVSDPPYELNFMNREWDRTGIAFDKRTWEAVLRVLKPGGFLLAFSGTRTYHRMAVAIEDAGFEIKDMILWEFLNGFPKSFDASKALDKAQGFADKRGYLEKSTGGLHGGTHTAGGNFTGRQLKPEPYGEDAKKWEGWGTSLAPAYEPICVARKPLIGRLADNLLAYGAGAMNIMGSRVGVGPRPFAEATGDLSKGLRGGGSEKVEDVGFGRWPKNILMSHSPDCKPLGPLMEMESGNDDYSCVPGCPVAELDRQSGITESSDGEVIRGAGGFWGGDDEGGTVARQYGDKGGASRMFKVFAGEEALFYYVPKASRVERDHGLEELKAGITNKAAAPGTVQGKTSTPADGAGRNQYVLNSHSTVKPIQLMRYLVKLVTPPIGIVLDPFLGSGTTLIAAKIDGFNAIGIEKEAEYVKIAELRLKANWKDVGGLAKPVKTYSGKLADAPKVMPLEESF